MISIRSQTDYASLDATIEACQLFQPIPFVASVSHSSSLTNETMFMKNPPHPGLSIKQNCLEPLGLSLTEASEMLGVARHSLSRVLNGDSAISPEMAIRLEKDGWSNADFWLRRQSAFELSQVREREGDGWVTRG